MDQSLKKINYFVVEGLHCPSCIRKVEGALQKMPGIDNVNLNFSTQRLSVEWANENAGSDEDSLKIIDQLDNIGFKAFPLVEKMISVDEKEAKILLKAIAVAGFAAANVMLLSVSDWFGTDMNENTRQFFHWISALIILPAAAYSGRPFYRSAWSALKNKRLNMEVPISVAVLLACAMSLTQTIMAQGETYFDAAIMLLFFLLVGRYLDRKMRCHARETAQNLISYKSYFANVIGDNGQIKKTGIKMISQGATILVATGERIAIDGVVSRGVSEVDASIITGETVPEKIKEGSNVFAGTINLGGAIDIKVTNISGGTVLDEIIKLMENAEQNRANYVRLADKAARIYAPAVHLLALATFLGWYFLSDVGWQSSIITAIAVLIITCPCALGLAVPVVQVVASSRLFKSGILLKSPDGLERLAEIDTIVFDKTGSLTLGQPEVDRFGTITVNDLKTAASMASASRHPLSCALVKFCAGRKIFPISLNEQIEEVAGQGLKVIIEGISYRLGNREWCQIETSTEQNSEQSEIWFVKQGSTPIHFTFKDQIRRDAKSVVKWFQSKGIKIMILSGDKNSVVRNVADELNIDQYYSETKPQDKIRIIEELKQNGRKVLMVGDGLNDAPALCAAHVSISPSTAAEISQSAADFVFQSEYLQTVVRAYQISKFSRKLVMMNFLFAALYNVIAIPFAAMGLLTPLIAALAMSSSSIVVIVNALRLNLTHLFTSTRSPS